MQFLVLTGPFLFQRTAFRFTVCQGFPVDLPVLYRQAGLPGLFLQLLVSLDCLVDFRQLSCNLEQVCGFFFKLINNLPQGRNTCAGGKKCLANFTLLGKNVFATLYQSFMVETIKRFKNLLLNPMEKRG